MEYLSEPPATAPQIHVTSAGRTHPGKVRDHNEDHLRLYPPLDLFILADGMGGHNAGEVASALAAVSVENCFRASTSKPLPPALENDPRDLSPTARRVVAAVRKANTDVFEISQTHREHRGMGTTLVVVHVERAAAIVHVAHVGDSRCYRIRKGRIEQLTRDHSLVGDALAWKPDITEEELALLPKNMISRAIGRRESVEIDILSEPVMSGDIFLLCSDGLSGMVNDEDILAHVQRAPSLDEACDGLIERANAAGGEDNVTAALVRVDVGASQLTSDRAAPAPR